MQIMIDTSQCPCRELNDECGISGMECYEDDICATCPLIRNGGVKLPKGHGNLIDYDDLIEKLDRYGRKNVKYQLPYSPTIIFADKGANADGNSD